MLNLYSRTIDASSTVKRKDVIVYTIESLWPFWHDKWLSDIKRSTCQAYVTWRTAQKIKSFKDAKKARTVSESTARRDLETLRAAVNNYHAETPLTAVPIVKLPARANPRERWLTRQEAAAMIRTARSSNRTKHLARFILIGVYTGTRHEAILRLHWQRTPAAGWVDLEAGVLHRRGSQELRTKKQRPPSRLPRRLLAHLRRWRRLDLEAQKKDPRKPINLVVHYYGRPVTRLKTAWASVREAAELGRDVTPHVLRHTAATWYMQRGVDLWETSGIIAMSVEMLQDVYGHHHPDFQRTAAEAF